MENDRKFHQKLPVSHEGIRLGHGSSCGRTPAIRSTKPSDHPQRPLDEEATASAPKADQWPV
jgi:hypothetical protein